MERSGQTLMVAVLLGLILVVGVTVTVLINQRASLHQTAGDQRTKGQFSAEDGIAYATQKLSVSSDTWQNALSANFTGTECNTGNMLTTPSGTAFKLYCSTGSSNPGLQPYQIAVTAVAYGKGSEGNQPLRAVRAYLSQRTLGTDLTTDVHAAAAVQLVRKPVTNGQLNVHWGPIVCLDAGGGSSWNLPAPIESQRYPRKFSQGGLRGVTFSRSGTTMGAGPRTDQREYMAHIPQTFVPLVDEDAYIAEAKAVTANITRPTVSGVAVAPSGCTSTPADTCGYFDVGTNTAFFDAAAPGYTVPPGSVIYVKGNAMFGRLAVTNATFIVTGNVMIGDTPAGSVFAMHVPVNAAREYPYAPTTPTTWPCSSKAGNMASGVPAYDCSSADTSVLANLFPSGTVNFHGFLYVKGNLEVMSTEWNMAGALLVGDPSVSASGQLAIIGGKKLNIAYDDVVNHNIHMNPVLGTAIKVVPDLIQDVPVF